MSDNNNDTKQPLNKDFREPKIRFPEFRDEWQYQKLSCYLDVSKERNKGGIYTEEDVLSVSGTEGVVNQIEHMGRSYAGASLDNYKVVKTTGVVYTKSPLKSNPYGIIKTNTGIDGIVSSLYGVYVGKSNINTELIGIYFNLDSRLNNYLKPLVNKGPKNTLLISDQGALEGDLYLPKSLEEQNTIVDLFDKIQTLSRDIDLSLTALKKYKEGLVNSLYMFNTNGPKIRFNEFSAPWKKVLFGDFVFPSGEKNKSHIELESYSISNTDGFIKQNVQFKQGGLVAQADKNKSVIVNPKSFAYNPARLDVGSMGYQNLGKQVLVSPMYEIFGVDNKIVDDIFLWHYLKSNEFNKIVRSRQEGGVRTCFNLSKLCDTKIYIPESLKEQEKICSFINVVDNLIGNIEKQTKRLLSIKDFLLRNMFI